MSSSILFKKIGANSLIENDLDKEAFLPDTIAVSGETIPCLFIRNPRPTNSPMTVDYLQSTPFIIAKASDTKGIENSSVIALDESQFRVIDIEPDGYGLVKFYLEAYGTED